MVAQPPVQSIHAEVGLLKQIWRNRACRYSGLVMLCAFAVVLGGYWVLPDSTPDVNGGNIQLRKQGVNFTVPMLKVRKNVEQEHTSLWRSWWSGTPSSFLLEPYDSLKVAGDLVMILPFGSHRNQWKRFHLCDIVMPLYVGPLEAMSFPSSRPYMKEKNGYRVLLADGSDVFVSRIKLKELLKSHIQTHRFLLGTDRAGRDLLSRLLFGARASLTIGLFAALVSLLIGVLVGSVAGYFGGWQDVFLRWLMSVVWSVPGIMLIIAISMALHHQGVFVSVIAVGLTMWVDVARLVRGKVMSLKHSLFVEAARSIGLSDYKIVIVHILPNIGGELIVMATVNFAAAILLEAGLSFLGMGVQPPTPSWGAMLMEGFGAIGTNNSLHLVLFPSLAIMLMVGAINVFGNGLRDVLDPKRIK